MFSADPTIDISCNYPNEYYCRPLVQWMAAVENFKMRHPVEIYQASFIKPVHQHLNVKGGLSSYNEAESALGRQLFFSNACLPELIENGLLPNHNLG